MNLHSKPGSVLREYAKGEIGQDRFFREVLPAARPVVMRGVVSDWPAVVVANSSDASLIDYLSTFAAAQPVQAAFGPPGIRGRLFYNATLDGLNFRRGKILLRTVFEQLLAAADKAEPGAIAVQSMRTIESLPGFDQDNRLSWLPDSIKARAWIGNRITVAAHYDSSENIACVVAGRRRFTLFPPDQVANLYPGPFELTPAGPIVSMVDFDDPDHDRYPKFRKALNEAYVVDLEPGDAIYIPYLWWHHVRSVDPINMLVNYWWNPATATTGKPLDAMLHAMFAIKNLDPHHREAWASLFDHFVFQRDGEPGIHLSADRRGIQGALPPSDLREALAAIGRSLSSP